jgi:putative membrane protein insertion efficiency factor
LLLGGAALACASLLTFTPYPLRAEIAAIHLYQRALSPVVSHFARCRFQPTCSHYAVERLEADGFWFGNAKIAGRLFMCSPIGYLIDLFSDTPRFPS